MHDASAVVFAGRDDESYETDAGTSGGRSAGVITFSLLKGLVGGVATGYVSQRIHSMLVGILAGIGIAAALSLLVILRAGMALFWDILLPGMLLGAIVGFATQRFGKTAASAVATQ